MQSPGKLAVAGGALLLALLLLGALLWVSGNQKDSPPVDQLLRGIPQEGLRLGDPDADLLLVEWADLECPSCRDFAQGELSEIIRKEVRPGRLQIELRQWPILGPSSTEAARAALAASLQNRYWQFVEYYYASQGEEVTDEFLESVAREAGVPDIEKWKKDREDPRWDDELLRNDSDALRFDFQGTPSFALQRSGKKLQPLQISSPGELLRRLQE